MKRRLVAAVLCLLALCACKVGPNYKRPAVPMPPEYRGAPSQTNAPQPEPANAPGAYSAPTPAQASPPTGSPTVSFGEMKWWTVFQDPVLEKLIREALTNNYNLRIAATRILQARALLGITRADQFPSIAGSASIQNVRNRLFPGAPTFDSISIDASYIVDFWGQYRRATEASRANLLATEFGQEVVRTTLISDLASAYFQLRQFDAQLEYSNKSLAADQEMLRINTINYKGGEFAKTDVLQAQLLVEQAESQIITLKQAIEQTENTISILLGGNPGPVDRGLSLTDQPHLPDVPAGLPSTLLKQRPDVRQSEMFLVAANANVGVAKAAFFPQFALTGSFGALGTSVTSYLQGPSTFWAVGGQVVQPLFQGGRIRSNYRLAWARRDEAELQYKQTVQLAVADVSNSLIGYTQSRQFRMKMEEQTATYGETARLAGVRFRGGATSFLEVLVTEQQYFTSQLALAQAWNSELQNYLQLYRALGGGWEP